MIIYPKEIIIDKSLEFELGEYRIKMLEKTLSLLGNFNIENPIKIDSYTIEPNCDITFKIKDEDESIFTFINFDLADINGENPKRYEQSFYLTMQRADSEIQFIYDFINVDNKIEHGEYLRLIELNSAINDQRKIIMQRLENEPVTLKVQEADKIYEIKLNMKEDNDIVKFITNFKNLKDEISKLKEISLGNLLKLINAEVHSCSIMKQNKMLVKINFSNNKLRSYEYIYGNKKITTTLYEDKAIRTVETNQKRFQQEITAENYDKMLNEAKILLKLK